MTNTDTNTLKNQRRTNTFEFLYNKGYLKIGDKLVLKHNVDFNSYLNKEVLNAQVEVVNGNPKLKWLFDGDFYSITGLTNKIFKEYDVKPTVKRNNGNCYWGLDSDDISLFGMVKNSL